MSKTNKKDVHFPVVVHGSSQKSQGEFFRNTAEKWARGGGNTKYGKGSGRRTEAYKKVIDNWPLNGCKNQLGNKDTNEQHENESN